MSGEARGAGRPPGLVLAGAPAAAGCFRVENGTHLGNIPGDVLAGHCNAGLKLFGWMNPVRDRRYPLVDEERGLVWALGVMDSKPGARGGRGGGSSTFAQELFKIVDGRTRRMEVHLRSMPYGAATGWSN